MTLDHDLSPQGVKNMGHLLKACNLLDLRFSAKSPIRPLQARQLTQLTWTKLGTVH